MKPNTIFVAALVASAIAITAYAQEKPATPPPGMPMHEQKGATMMGDTKGDMMGSMMAADKTMMAKRQKMMSEMDATGARLEGLVAQMNSAEGARKMDVMASAITELVAQQTRMRHDMMSMSPEMMKHMMAHMKSGTMDGMQKSMSMCPMMQDADAAKGGEQDHADHHPESQR
jgi:hypothetical protein